MILLIPPNLIAISHWPIVTHLCQWSGASLIHVMVCCMFVANPVPGLYHMLEYECLTFIIIKRYMKLTSMLRRYGPLVRYVKLWVAHARECRERFSRHWLQRKPLYSDPGMHHGTCVTHVPWCMSGSLIHGGGENVPGIPGACATRNFTYLARGPCVFECICYWWWWRTKLRYAIWFMEVLITNRDPSHVGSWPLWLCIGLVIDGQCSG